MSLAASSFLVVMMLTEWLPVAPFPEESAIASVWYLMVNDRCWPASALLEALYAPWVLGEKRFALPLPVSVI